MASRAAVKPSANTHVHLSRREGETLSLLLEGLSDKEIAARLTISRYTVNQYTKAIYARFGVHSRASLLARVLKGDAYLPNR